MDLNSGRNIHNNLGRVCGTGFVSTFGLLPPAFLPVGNQRLYELQAELIDKTDSRKIISVPDDFMIEDHERARLMALGFDIIPVPTGISLGASIAHVLERGSVTSGKLEILHGDTYIFGLPTDKTDIVSEGTSSDYYSWAEYETTPSGGFRFSMVYGRGNLPREAGPGRFSQVISVLRIRIFTEPPSLYLTFTLSHR